MLKFIGYLILSIISLPVAIVVFAIRCITKSGRKNAR